MAESHNLHAVTGAFSYSGKYIARRLLDAGRTVITLTNSRDKPDPFGGQVQALPFHFDDPGRLAISLQGVDVLYNTYWVRFNHTGFTHAEAVKNTLLLFEAARQAGVRRVVHVSITNPDEHSALEYFAGKGRLERGLQESGLSYAILRPTVLFGKEDILINNIAWALRRLPVFGVFGAGQYRLQPIYVDDLAELAVAQGALQENVVINAIGPESFTYKNLVETIGELINCRRPVLPMPPRLAFLAGQAIGALQGDVTITWPEVLGLMADLLHVDAPPASPTRLTDWIRQHAQTLGQNYANELSRRKPSATVK